MTPRLVLLLLCASSLVRAQAYGRPAVLNGIGIDPHMGAQTSLDLPFSDEYGQPVTLQRYTGKPIVLALVYYQCPALCNLVLSGLVTALRGVESQPGRDFEVAAVSFDPRDTPAVAAAKKAGYMERYGRPDAESGWHFLTGPESSSRALADSAGFHYTFDQTTGQFAHPSALVVLTPEGRVSSYFYGVNYSSRDLRLALLDAAEGRSQSPLDQILLYCFHYDAAQGKYSLAILAILRAAGIATALALGGFVLAMHRRDRKASHG